MSKVEQYVMAYRGDEEAIKSLLPSGYTSLRPVLRINAEIISGKKASQYIEFNTPVEHEGKRGWLNLYSWDSKSAEITVEKEGKTTEFCLEQDMWELLNIEFTGTGAEGGCPKEADNDGTFYISGKNKKTVFKPAEQIDARKEYCDCRFQWEEESSELIPDLPDCLLVAVAIPAEEILGAYRVVFTREQA